MPATAPQQDARPAWIKWAVAALAVGGLILAYSLLPLQEWIDAFRAFVVGLGPVGWLVFVVVYALAVLVLLPGSLLTLAAGLAWGLWGFPIVIVGATIGAGLSFLAARYLARDKAQAMLETRPRLKAVDRAVGDGGWRIVGLLRLSPAFPFALQNWFLGTTSIGFWPYLIATFVGIMPGTLLYVWIGSLGGTVGGDETSLARNIALGVGLLATLLVTVYVTKLARAKLAEAGVDEG